MASRYDARRFYTGDCPDCGNSVSFFWRTKKPVPHTTNEASWYEAAVLGIERIRGCVPPGPYGSEETEELGL